jgi:hypothetical protein
VSERKDRSDTILDFGLRPVRAYPPACKSSGLEAAPEGLRIFDLKKDLIFFVAAL